jgi:hypothetical protein
LVDVILGNAASVAAFEQKHERVTRAHTLAETFSQLTGGALRDETGDPFRLDADDAAEAIGEHADKMKILSLAAAETLAAQRQARRRGVRGGAVHDYLHIVAAELSRTDRSYTLDAGLATLSSIPAIAP